MVHSKPTWTLWRAVEGWMPHFASITCETYYGPTYDNGVEYTRDAIGVDLKTKCGSVIKSLKQVNQQLLTSPTSKLYVSSQSSPSSWRCLDCGPSRPSCRSCGTQGIVEPLSNILGTLGAEQHTARWRVVLVLKIMEVWDLVPDVARTIIRFFPRPGTMASMMAHPVCTCNVCAQDEARLASIRAGHSSGPRAVHHDMMEESIRIDKLEVELNGSVSIRRGLLPRLKDLESLTWPAQPRAAGLEIKERLENLEEYYF